MNFTVVLSFFSVVIFTLTIVILMMRRHVIGWSGGVFFPLLLSLLLYDFIVMSNFLEHAGITAYFDPLEDILEIVFTLMFLFFVNNWRKEVSEVRFRELFKLAPMPLTEVTRNGHIVEANEQLANKINEYFGITIAEMPTLTRWFELAYPDEQYRAEQLSQWEKAVGSAFETGVEIVPEEIELTAQDGLKRTMIVNTSIIGENILISMVDITDRKREEAALIESLELLRATFDASPDGILVVNRDLKVTQANQQFHKMWHIPEYLQSFEDIESFGAIVKDQLKDPEGFQQMVDTLYRYRTDDVYEISFKDGRAFECYTAPMVLNENEVGWVWDFRDITKQKEAETARETLQKQLHQSQKLEAIGILAGGIAHDFNNMLGAILGYGELTMEDMQTDNPFRENIAKIVDAANRSAALVRQLLIFARKQNIAPVVIDVNESVEGILKMLRRLIGENIELAWLPASSNCIVKMDPSQLDQILANLCVNAKDAITDIGKITIKTGISHFDELACKPYVDCTPGAYACLSVIDNGFGMDKDTAERVFEPFFTTKGVGEGTGLGLATVYGIVKQNQGFINLYSEKGIGTAFNIYLPLHTEAMHPEQLPYVDDIPRGHGETVLMVEDDPILIDMSRVMLERLGYKVVAATTPREAIEMVLNYKGDIHLFLTDVVMPEMNGSELMERLSEIRPGVNHLFMSGYTADVIVNRGVSGEDDHFIQKPFSQKEIAIKIHEVLQRRNT